MVAINPLAREVTFKVVFYGPGLGGKTTSLQIVHDKARPEQRGKMVSLATPIDRTLYFDYLPYRLAPVRGMGVRLQLFTVPGQVHFNATRKLVLNGADGVVFVADSQVLRADANLESFENLRDNLLEQRRELETVPLVFQYNKRDLPDVLPVEELERLLNAHGAPAVPTVAVRGQGVFETLDLITNKVLESFERRPVRALSPPPSPIAPSGGGLAEALQALGAEDRGESDQLGALVGGDTAEGEIARGEITEATLGLGDGTEGAIAKGEITKAALGLGDGTDGAIAKGEITKAALGLGDNTEGAIARGDAATAGGRGSAAVTAWQGAEGAPRAAAETAGKEGRIDRLFGGRAARGEVPGRVPALEARGDDDDTMEPSRAAAILLGLPLPEEPAPPSDPLLEVDADDESIEVPEDDGGDGPPTAAFRSLASSSAPESFDMTTLAPASFSFANLWPKRERDAVLAAEGAMAAGDGRRAIELLDGLASRTTLAAVSLVGASDTGAAATAFAPLLLGVNGPRYAAFRAIVRQVRGGLSPDPKQVLAAYALVIDLVLAKEQLLVSQGGQKHE
ncbi:MAG: ADP-ribosylation factor-like protein [Polyangiaceae bacterium]|nr:ADP-ribosylation factor-like protein [Polyangiaceae bacterium]